MRETTCYGIEKGQVGEGTGSDEEKIPERGGSASVRRGERARWLEVDAEHFTRWCRDGGFHSLECFQCKSWYVCTVGQKKRGFYSGKGQKLKLSVQLDSHNGLPTKWSDRRSDHFFNIFDDRVTVM